jgi:hypothetical protein
LVGSADATAASGQQLLPRNTTSAGFVNGTLGTATQDPARVATAQG